MYLYPLTLIFLVIFIFILNKNRGSLLNGFLFFVLMVLGGFSLSRLSYTTGSRVLLLIETIIILSLLAFLFSGLLLILLVSLGSGLVLIRKEGRNLSNLLSLLLGIGIIVWLFLQKVSFSNRAADKIFSYLLLIVNTIFVYLLVIFSDFIISSFLCQIYLPIRKQDYIIVLGAGLIHGDQISPLLAGRINKAIKIYKKQIKKKHSSPILIMSGGQGKDEKLPEGRAMEQYALSHGVPREHLLVDDRSKNTHENMLFSKQLIESRETDMKHVRILFSTTNYHVFRSEIYARRVHLKARGVGAKTKFYFWYNALLREYAALLVMNKKIHIICMILLIALAFALNLIPEGTNKLYYIEHMLLRLQ